MWIGSKDVPTLEEAGIQPENVDRFKKMIGSVTALYEDIENAYVFSYDQLPLKIGDTILYDVWRVKQYGKEGLRFRFSVSKNRIYYLSTKNVGVRYRYPVDGMRIKNSDNTFLETYHVTARRDEEMVGDKNYDNYTIDQADLITINGVSPNSMFILENPFKN
ncbi:hypothetical protein D3C81_1722560 [compost metagenome]